MTAMLDHLAKLRSEYADKVLDLGSNASCPISVFMHWLSDAMRLGLSEPNAMVLATSGKDGQSHARTVLCKGVSQAGLVFYTHYDSNKGLEMVANPHVSLTFLWLDLARQVRIEGKAMRLSRAESESYFALRPRDAQLAAYISPQSKPITDRNALLSKFEQAKERFKNNASIPCPKNWGGYCVSPTYMEFWQGRRHRLHDRIAYERHKDTWRSFLMAP